MTLKDTVLLIPPNDPEAVTIRNIARAMGLQMIISPQAHGATLEHEPDLLNLVKAGGWKRVVIVEIPGPKIEAQLRKRGIEVVIIDHHHYTKLDRATDPKTGKLLPSSLEQFLKLFRLTDRKLLALGFDPRLTYGIGVMDRGFVWALREEGFTKREIQTLLTHQQALMKEVRPSKEDAKRDAVARRAWKARTLWLAPDGEEYLVVETRSNMKIRSRISLLEVVDIGEPVPVILLEKGRGVLYVQESDHAVRLFKRFGGFTFGLNRCWGYQNKKGVPVVGLKEIRKVLSEM